MRRAVVTGLGFVTSIGRGRAEVLASLRSARNGISALEALDREGNPIRLAGGISDFSFPDPSPESWRFPAGVEIPHERLRSMSPNVVYAWCAMREAIGDAALTPELVSSPRTGAMCASGGSIWLIYEHIERMLRRGVARTYPFAVLASIAGTLNMNLAAAFGIKGASLGFSSACASSAHATGAAIDHIRLGRQDLVFVVGAEDCNLFNIGPFAALRALTTQTDEKRFPCPFDSARDGFVVAGGATVLVLEEMEHALRRNARIYAEALGWGESGDGYNVVAPDPSGDGLARAIRNALADAGCSPGEVDYLNAHATGTPAGDVAEIRAIRQVWPGRTPWISSTKAITGHGLSLAGAMEAAFCCLSISEGFIPISAKIENLDPACAAGRIALQDPGEPPRLALSHSCGFGGSNVVLAFRHADSIPFP